MFNVSGSLKNIIDRQSARELTSSSSSHSHAQPEVPAERFLTVLLCYRPHETDELWVRKEELQTVLVWWHCSGGSPVRFSTKRANFPKRANTGVMLSLIKMAFHPCVSGCCSYLAPDDSHDRCLMCLGIKQVEADFVDESCCHCRWQSRCCGRDSNTSGEVEPPYLCGE